MNVASKDLSRELYELSRNRWLGESSDCVSSSCTHHAYYEDGRFICPKYTLGYLLRKLEPHNPSLEFVSLSGCDGGGEAWQASVMLQDKPVHADIPEDAATKLCIELIKQGVISPNGEPTK